MKSSFKTTALTLLVALTSCGTGDGLQRIVASGEVNYQGMPVEYGQVRFVPQSETSGPVTIASVRDGRYTANGQGGVPVGEHRVEVLSYELKTVGSKWPTGPGSPPPPQLIAANYNTLSELQVTLDGPGKSPVTGGGSKAVSQGTSSTHGYKFKRMQR